jgi:hypothetical protein
MFNGVFLCICKCTDGRESLVRTKGDERAFRAMVLADGTRNGAHGKMVNCSFRTAAALHSTAELMREIKWKKFVARRMRSQTRKMFFFLLCASLSSPEASARKCNFLTGFLLFTAITRINFVCTRILFDLQPHWCRTQVPFISLALSS